MPKFHDFGIAIENCAYSAVLASKSKTFNSGRSAVVSTACASAPLVVVPNIASAGTKIVSVPAILTAAVPLLSVPVPKGLMLRSIFESVELVEIAARIGPVPVAAFVILSSLTGVLTSVKTRFSSPPASAINPPDANFGEDKILFVSVSAPVKEAKL